MKNQFIESYEFLIENLIEIDQLFLMSGNDQFAQQFHILRLRQKKEWDDLQDKWIFKGGKQKVDNSGHQAKAPYSATRPAASMSASE